jgi:Na+-driven multidrug efflux pump
MFSLAILYGLNMGIDTLVTYHFGKKDFEKCGIVLYKAIVFGFMLGSFTLILLLNTDQIL